MLQRALWTHGYTVFRAHTGRLALEAAHAAEPDLILVDYRVALPSGGALEVTRRLRDDPAVGPSVPILLLAALAPTEPERLAALRAGVWEVLVGAVPGEELRGRIDGYLRTRRELDRAGAHVEVDPPTGLYTARALARRARELTLQAFHLDLPLAAVAFAAMRPADRPRLAGMLRTHARRSDAVGRLDDEHFAVIAPGASRAGAVLLAERLAKRLGPAVELRAGFDAVENARRAPLHPRHLLERATAALLRARAAGPGEWIRESD